MNKAFKSYEIKTIGDILEVINKDNLKNFIRDFTNYLTIISEIKEVSPEMKKGTWEGTSIVWIDDKKNLITFKVQQGKKKGGKK